VERGVDVARTVIVGDALEDLVAGLRDLLASGPGLVCTSGGLGPTHDDRTMEAVAAVAGRPLVVDAEALPLVRAAYGGRARPGVGPETQRAIDEKQASLPAGATLLPPVGTAPGCVVQAGEALVVVLPGPPWELQAMWEAALGTREVRALLERAGQGPRRLLRLYGVIESQMVDALERMEPGLLDSVELGICARAAELEVAIAAPAAQAAAAARMEQALTEAFGEAVYSRDGATVEEIVARALAARGETVAVAESCTGGGLGARLTARAGSSEYFLGGVIAYDDSLKRGLLGVPAELLARHGAVSAECAVAMAEGARSAAGTPRSPRFSESS